MINHVRTLLLNQSSSQAQSVAFPGEEYVPLGFAPVTLTPGLKRVVDILFGQNPDRAMMNYRLRQYMTLIHGVPILDAHVKTLDSRITYLPSRDTTLVRASDYTVNVLQIPSGSARTLLLSGDVYSLSDPSRLRHVWTLEILSSSTVKVTKNTTPTDMVVENFSTVDGLTSAIPLVGSPLSVYLDPEVGLKWVVEIYYRPAASLIDVAERIERLDNSTLTELFGRGQEPFATYRKLWTDTNALGLATKLGSFVLALAYRLEERRKNRE